MRSIRAIRHHSVWLMITLVLAFAFVLSACGSTATTGSPAKTPTTTQTGNSGSPEGCPTTATYTPSSKASLVVTGLQQKDRTITAHKGDVIEFDMPFGRKWGGPTTSQGVLELQQPAGYVSQASHACVWRFIAQGTGQTNITFSARAICKPNQACPMYVLELPFTVNVK